MKISNHNHHVAKKFTKIMLLLCFIILAVSNVSYNQIHSQTSPLTKHSEQNDKIAAFLAAPIDLITFKKKKGPSNSGSFKANPWIYRPKEPGFFYRYMLFNTSTQFSESERFFGFSIVVYKFGKEVGDYYDRNEALVAIWSRLNDPDLGQANLVGRFVSEIKTRFGEPFDSLGDILIYYHRGRALSIHTNDGTVDWFKYVRLGRNIDKPGAIPELLLQPGFGR